MEPEIVQKACIRSGLIENYDDLKDQSDVGQLDLVIDDQTPSQNMTDELLPLNLNDSRSECSESRKSQNLQQSSFSSYFHKKIISICINFMKEISVLI